MIPSIEEISKSDLNLLRSRAIHMFVNESISDRCEILCLSIFEYLGSTGRALPKDYKTICKKISRDVDLFTLNFEESVQKILLHLKRTGIQVSKGENFTWSSRNSLWYTPYKSYKRPWMI